MEENKREENSGEIDIDPLLLMEDILDKLKLLDYEVSFSRVKYNNFVNFSEDIARYQELILLRNLLILENNLFISVRCLFGFCPCAA